MLLLHVHLPVIDVANRYMHTMIETRMHRNFVDIKLITLEAALAIVEIYKIRNLTNQFYEYFLYMQKMHICSLSMQKIYIKKKILDLILCAVLFCIFTF